MKSENLTARAFCLGLVLLLWGEIVPWAWFVATALLIASLITAWRERKPVPRWFTAITAIAAGLLIYIPEGSLIGRDPSAALLGVLAGLKALESRDRADERTLRLIGFFLVAVLFLFRADLWGFLAGVLASVFFLIGLLRTQPAEPSLAVSRRWAWRLSLRALPGALMLFFLVPRLQHGDWWTVGNRAQTGFREELNPSMVENLEEDLTPVLRATWTPAPPSEPVFWKGGVLEKTEGFSWSAGPRAAEEPRAADPDAMNGPGRREVEWILEDQGGRWAFAPEGSLAVREEPEGRRLSWAPSTGVWRWPAAPGERTRLRAAVGDGEVPGESSARLLEVPRRGPLFDAWVADVRGAGSRADIARALREKFRGGGFVYTRRPGRLADVDAFLAAKKGFCEHYASAGALILRASGVPARVAVGFLGGEWNPVGRFQIVTRADAHAWVEWLDESGLWQRFDATAVVPPLDPLRDRRTLFRENDAVAAASFWNRLRWRVESLNYDFAVALMGFDLDAQKALWTKVRGGAGAMTAGGLVLLLAAVGLAWRRGRFSWGEREPAEVRRYREWLRRGQARGWPLSAQSGPLDNLRRANEAAPEEESRSRRIVEAYIHRRFRRAN